MLGPVWDQDRLDALYSGADVHPWPLSGRHKSSLLRAMGAATATLAYDVSFNREVLGDDGRFFADPDQLAACIDAAQTAPDEMIEIGQRLQQRAGSVTTGTGDLEVRGTRARLAGGESEPDDLAVVARRIDNRQSAVPGAVG